MFRALFPLLPHRNIRLSIIFECEGIWRIDAPRAETDRLAGRNKRDLRNESIVLSAAAYMEGQFNIADVILPLVLQLPDDNVLDDCACRRTELISGNAHAQRFAVDFLVEDYQVTVSRAACQTDDEEQQQTAAPA